MVQAAPVGLPPKKDYINFGADQVLMQLIGGGKSVPSLLFMSHYNDLFHYNRHAHLRMHVEENQPV